MNGDDEQDGARPSGTAKLDELLVQLLAQPTAAHLQELEASCRAHPQHARGLRRRYAFLCATGMLDAEPEALPERIGDFRLLRRLGQGGMGVVYLAEQEKLRRRVALKVILPALAASPLARERFRREVQAIALLDHPNLCPVHDAGEIEGVPYLAMRYIAGETLADRIDRQRRQHAPIGAPAGPLAAGVEEVMALGAKLAFALHAAHEKGLVHRDVKPGNVMIEEATGEPLLLDFGLARLDDDAKPGLTMSGDRLGTPAYMAPEQIAGQPVDRRTDVYALGASLYEALTLRTPHQAPTRESLYRCILQGEITRAGRHNPAVPRDLEIVLATALDRDPGQRYRTAAEFAEDLQRVRQRLPIHARPIGAVLRARRWCQRHPYAASALVVLAAGLITTVALLGKLDDALRKQAAELLIRSAFDARAGNPGESLRFALQAARDQPSPRSVAAVRAAWHAPQVDVEFPTQGQINYAWDVARDGSIAWCTRDKRLFLRADGETRLLDTLTVGPPVFCLRFSPDGARLAVANNQEPLARVYDRHGTVLHSLKLSLEGHPTMRVFSVAWHPRQDLLAVGSGTAETNDGRELFRVHLYDLAPEKPRWSREVRAWPWHLRFLDDDRLAVATGAGTHPMYPGFTPGVHVFGIDSGKVEHAEHKKMCTEMAVTGGMIVTAGHDGLLVLWRPGDEPQVRGHPGTVATVDVSPDGEQIATACSDGFVRLFDRRGEVTSKWESHGSLPMRAAVFRPDGQALLVRLRDGGRRLMTLDGRLLAELPGSEIKWRDQVV